MIVYFQLFITFFKIGLFSFGGGLAMLPIIEREVVSHAWLTIDEFLKVVSISQMTPGPIAVNTATFVGNKVAGLSGAMVSTIALSLPSVIIMLLISTFLLKVADHPVKINIFIGIKSVTIALILYAAYTIGMNTFIIDNQINIIPIIMSLIVFILLRKTKLHPLAIIALAGVAGYFII